jgi:DNA-binding IclR family transcriptional regulator
VNTDVKLVKSAGRVFSILEYFDEKKKPASAVQIRNHLGLPPSSTSVLLRSLVSLGYLTYDPGPRTYFPTLRVALLGNWIHGASPADLALHQLMERLNVATGEIVVLGTRNGLQAQYVHVVQASSPMRLYLKPGTFGPLTRTSVGWVLLSSLSDREISRIATRVNAEEEDPAKRVEPQWLCERINEVRRNGYAFCFGRVKPGVGAVGMPLPRSIAHQPVVLAISGIGESFVANKDAYVALLRDGIDQYLDKSAL